MEQMTDEVSFGDKRVEITSYDRYKGRKGFTDRITILSSTVSHAWRHYPPRSNSSPGAFRCLSTPTQRATCCEILGAPEQRFGLTLFKYQTDDNGNLLDPTKCGGKIFFWVISETRYNELSALHAKWALLDAGEKEKQFDMTMNCTEEQYQKMTIQPCPEAHWKTKESWYKALKNREINSKEKLKSVLGKKLSLDEVKTALGVSTAASGGAAPTQASDINLDSVVDDI